MQKPATVLRKWCESEKPIEPPLARLSLAYQGTPEGDKWHKLIQLRDHLLRHVGGLPPADVDRRLGIELPHPRELALGKPPGRAGHALLVATQQLLEAQRGARGDAGAGGVGPANLLGCAGRDHLADPAVDRLVQRLALHD